jgi:FlaA1/EpsC-like NDP-sugar epimerase
MPKNKINAFFQFLINFRNEKINFNDFKYLPGWVILYIDIFIVLIGVLVNYTVLSVVDANILVSFPINLKIFFYLATHAFFFIIFKTYSGLIRHSTHIDVVKLFLAISSANLFVIALDNFQSLITTKKIFHTTAVIFTFLSSFSFLLLFRIGIRMIFEKLSVQNTNQKKIKTLVFCTGSNAIPLIRALTEGVSNKFEIVGFVTNDYNIHGKRIFGIKAYSSDRPLPILLRHLKIEAIIIGDDTLLKTIDNKVIVESLEKGIKIFKVPLLTESDSLNDIQKKVRSINIEELLQRDSIYLDKSNISDAVFNNIILVTGGAGSIGSEIVSQLANFNPKTILIVDQAETPLHDLELELIKKFQFIDLKFIIADVRDEIEMENIFIKYQPNIIYHTAAYKHVPLMEKNISQAILANVMGTQNVANLAVKYKASKFVFVSTDKAVNPTNIMGASKRIAEIYIQSLSKKKEDSSVKTKFITTRFGNVLGSNGSVVELFKKQISEGGPITLTHKDVTRFFMTIPEACQLVLEAGAMGDGGEIFLFDMGESVKIYDLARNMILLSGLKPLVDIEIKFVGLRPGEKLYEELLSDESITMPTHHQKIMIAKEMHFNQEESVILIEKLIKAVRNSDENLALELIRELVPEYQKPEFYNSIKTKKT